MAERLRSGLFAGLTAAAATAGVLIGFGFARGAPWRLINSDAAIVFGNNARLHDDFNTTVTVTGLVVHVLSVLLWGLLFAIATRRVRVLWLALTGMLFASAVYVIDIVLLPGRLAPGFENALSTPELIVVFATLGFSLAAGAAMARGKIVTNDPEFRASQANPGGD